VASAKNRQVTKSVGARGGCALESCENIRMFSALLKTARPDRPPPDPPTDVAHMCAASAGRVMAKRRMGQGQGGLGWAGLGGRAGGRRRLSIIERSTLLPRVHTCRPARLQCAVHPDNDGRTDGHTSLSFGSFTSLAEICFRRALYSVKRGGGEGGGTRCCRAAKSTSQLADAIGDHRDYHCCLASFG